MGIACGSTHPTQLEVMPRVPYSSYDQRSGIRQDMIRIESIHGHIFDDAGDPHIC